MDKVILWRLMDKVILWRLPDGGIAIDHPRSPIHDSETEPEYLERVKAECKRKSAKEWDFLRYATQSEVAKLSREYRDAWDDVNGEIQFNMRRARAIHISRIRSKRDKKLQALDIDYMIATEKGDSAAIRRIAEEKRVLRDLPATIQPKLDECKTIEELKAISPL